MEQQEAENINPVTETNEAKQEEADIAWLREGLKRTHAERFYEMMRLIKEERAAHPEKFPFRKPGWYFGGVLWEPGDELVTGEDGLQHVIKKQNTL